MSCYTTNRDIFRPPVVLLVTTYYHPRMPSYSIGSHFTRFIKEQLASKRYGNASEVIRAALRLLEEAGRVTKDDRASRPASGSSRPRTRRPEDSEPLRSSPTPPPPRERYPLAGGKRRAP